MSTDDKYEDQVTLVDSNSLRKNTTQDKRLLDEHLKKHTWAYYSMTQNGYMCKISEIFFIDKPCPSDHGRGAWSHVTVLLKENLKKCFSRHEKSSAHVNAVLMKTNAHIEDALSKSNKKTEEKRSNELYIGKLIKAVHFLAANNLPVKELYPKLVNFLADIEEPVVKQYLGTLRKNATYQSSDSCNSFLLPLNTYFKELVNERACHAQDIVLFADEATFAARKEKI